MQIYYPFEEKKASKYYKISADFILRDQPAFTNEAGTHKKQWDQNI